MTLKREDFAKLSLLLDEALALDAAGRRAWLENLSPEHQPLAQALRAALFPDAAQREKLATLPKIAGTDLEKSAASGLAAGSRVGPYELVRLLGAGGMAEVWLARRADGALKREVALKLPMLTRFRQELAERFSRERDILAGLEHPNIARLYDAGVDAEGLPYLAMEYVRGQPLTAWCDERKLGIPERLELLRHVLEAVQYAHDKHVIHRDLKPSNILVSEAGQVQLLDFGVAKLLEDTDGAQLTRAYGQALTPDYSSPEQLKGDAIDARSDIYSLGVVLYELLTGQRPYALKSGASVGTLEQALETTEIRKPSTQVGANAGPDRGTSQERLGQELRGDLDVITLKALAKHAAERYESAAAMAEDLRRYLAHLPIHARPAPITLRVGKFVRRNRPLVALGALAAAAVIGALLIEARRPLAPATEGARSGGAQPTVAAFSPPPHSLVVLPLLDLSGDPDQGYFSDGMTEELITALSQVSSLKVIARTSSFAFKGRKVDVGTIARTLNVGSILEGSVRRAGSQVRVSVQLIDGRDGFHVWSQDYDRDLKSVPAMQSEIATTVARELKATLLRDETEKIEAGGTRNTEAYDAFLRGLELFLQEKTPESIALLEKAVRLDPRFARAWAQLSIAYTDNTLGSTVPAVWLARARAAAETALKLDPQLVVAHTAMVWVASTELDWDRAVQEVEAAEALDAMSPETLHARSNLDFRLGRWSDAIAAARASMDRDPLRIGNYGTLGGALSASGRHREAAQVFRQGQELEPLSDFHAWIAGELLLDHRPDEALAEGKLARTESERDQALAMVYYALGRRADSDRLLAALEKKYGSVPGYLEEIAQIHAFRGETDVAFQWLERALAAHDPYLSGIKGNIGTYPNINRDPRYLAILRRLGLPE